MRALGLRGPLPQLRQLAFGGPGACAKVRVLTLPTGRAELVFQPRDARVRRVELVSECHAWVHGTALSAEPKEEKDRAATTLRGPGHAPQLSLSP